MPSFPPVYRLVALAAALVALGVPAQAQQFGRVERTTSNATAYYFYTQPGQATIQVTVAGSVRNPGLYEVVDGSNLGQVLALAGGPTLDPRQNTRRRTVSVALYRPQAGERPIYEADLGMTYTQPGQYPTLREGDALVVEVIEKERFSWRDLLSVAGAIGAVAYFIDAISQ